MSVKEKKWIFIGALIILTLFGGYIVSVTLQENPDPSDEGLVIIDGLDRVVNIPENPDRIVSMAAACTVILYDLESLDTVVGVDKYSPDYVLETSEKTNVGSAFNPSIETIIDLEPDLIFAWHYTRSYIEHLEDDIPIVYIDPKSVEDVLSTMKSIGVIIDRECLAEKEVSSIENRISKIEDEVNDLCKEDRPLVYYELVGLGSTLSQGTFTDEMILKAGGINIATGEPLRYPLLSTEYIIERDPEVIIVVSYGEDVEEIKNRPGWNELSAVRENRVYEIDSSWVSATPRMILGLEEFANWFHPDLLG